MEGVAWHGGPWGVSQSASWVEPNFRSSLCDHQIWRMYKMENQARASSSENTSAGNFGQMLNDLARPQAFPFALADKETIAVTQTHASAVILTADYAYKLKKPHNFGFFDYSTPVLRRYYCQQEIELNTALAPKIYLGIAPIIICSDK